MEASRCLLPWGLSLAACPHLFSEAPGSWDVSLVRPYFLPGALPAEVLVSGAWPWHSLLSEAMPGWRMHTVEPLGMAYISFLTPLCCPLDPFSSRPGQGCALSHHSGLASEDLGWGVCHAVWATPSLLQRITGSPSYSPDPEGFLPGVGEGMVWRLGYG